MDDTNFKTRYRKELIALLDKCMNEETGNQAILLVHTPAMRTVAMYAINADAPATQSILLAAAEPFFGPAAEGLLN